MRGNSLIHPGPVPVAHPCDARVHQVTDSLRSAVQIIHTETDLLQQNDWTKLRGPCTGKTPRLTWLLAAVRIYGTRWGSE
jgi:hypothetical protein